MATEQVTLTESNRRGEDPGDSVRIVLTTASDPWGSAGSAWIDFSSLLFGYGSAETLADAGEIADEIIAKGSPAAFGSGQSGIDQVVYIYGESTVDVLGDISSLDAEITQIIIPSLGSLGESFRMIADSLEALGNVVGVQISLPNPDSDTGQTDLVPGSSEFEAVLESYRLADRAGVQLQREACKRDIRRWAQVDKDDGRAGLGFEWVEVDDGTEWVPGDDYDEVCSILEMVRDGEISKNKAAAELGTSPRTIRRCIEDRPDRYGL